MAGVRVAREGAVRHVCRRGRIPPVLLLGAPAARRRLIMPLSRGATVNRTYGTDKNLYISLFLLNNICSYLLWSHHRNSVVIGFGRYFLGGPERVNHVKGCSLVRVNGGISQCRWDAIKVLEMLLAFCLL